MPPRRFGLTSYTRLLACTVHQFVKDTELEGGNVAPALESFVAMLLEAAKEPTLPAADARESAALLVAVEEAARLILDGAASCRRLRKASSIKKFREALVWYRDRLLALKVGRLRCCRALPCVLLCSVLTRDRRRTTCTPAGGVVGSSWRVEAARRRPCDPACVSQRCPLCVGGPHTLPVCVRRYERGKTSMSLTVCNTGGGVQYHPSTVGDYPKSKTRTALHIADIPVARITSPAFLYVSTPLSWGGEWHQRRTSGPPTRMQVHAA